MVPIKNRYTFATKIDKVEQEIKENLDRSASKLDRTTSEMPGMHQPSAFSTKVSVILFYDMIFFLTSSTFNITGISRGPLMQAKKPLLLIVARSNLSAFGKSLRQSQYHHASRFLPNSLLRCSPNPSPTPAARIASCGRCHRQFFVVDFCA